MQSFLDKEHSWADADLAVALTLGYRLEIHEGGVEGGAGGGGDGALRWARQQALSPLGWADLPLDGERCPSAQSCLQVHARITIITILYV